MRLTFRIFFGGAAAWFGRGANILFGLVLMPVLFRHLPKQELGLWLMLGQTWAALSIFDFGFGVVLTRRMAFVARCGGQRLDAARNADLAELVALGRRLYTWLGFLSLAISFATGFWFLRGIGLAGQPASAAWTAWAVLCLAQGISTWAAGWTCLLQALGYVGWDTIVASVVNALTLLVQILVVLAGGGVVGLAVTAAVGALVQRLSIVRLVRSRCRYLPLRHTRWRTGLFREMLPLALRAWLTSVGYLLLANTDQFFIAAFRGTTALPPFRAAFLLVINLHLLAGVFSGASPVFVSQLWQAGDMEGIRVILRRNAQIGLWTMACGAAAILALGPALFQLWLGPGNFVGYPVLAVFLAIFLLEHHANVFSTCGRATDDEAYAASSIATGLLKIFLAWFLTARFGLVGLACSTLLAQAAVNDWFMVWRSARRLNVKFGAHFREVLLPFAVLFLASLCLGLFLKSLTRQAGLAFQVLAVGGTAMVLLAGSLWQFALAPSHRTWVLRRLRLA
ncbi:MAG TPA: lipopolysaccharide biosynthesis protein [Verrucomicrobiae bacterium]|nr:lipopolysaccharide biosynthesis protein [Verrucomicrobiae bacterium]